MEKYSVFYILEVVCGTGLLQTEGVYQTNEQEAIYSQIHHFSESIPATEIACKNTTI